MKIVKEYTLDYCNVQYREDGIVELEILEGVNIDADMANYLVRLAEENIGKPFGMISNRIHSYSLSFEAMSILAQYEKLAALAIVVHSTKSRLLVETQNFFIGALKKKPIQIFMDVATAEAWLQSTLRALENNAETV
ncbi:MAG TPA: hypothetical protein ENI97_14715 [Gammaproteobacteria bacterium]|nr:hypothetical protein [Gammaproteobacteria bacterium]